MVPKQSLASQLYHSASGKYLKFKARLDRAIQSGRFKKLSRRKQSTLLHRLRKLYERLKSLHLQWKVAGAALGITLMASSQAKAQQIGPFEEDAPANPFPTAIYVSKPKPATVDIDNDGDLDIFVGSRNGYIQFFRNDSPSGKVRRFTEVTGEDNPLDGINRGNDAAIAFADIDGDEDMDLLIGNHAGQTFFYRNDNGTFTEQTGASNPFNGVDAIGSDGYYGPAIPTLIDFDKDGDIDVIMGSSYRYAPGEPIRSIQFFENNGAGVFTQQYGEDNPFNSYGNETENAVTLADIDNDGDLDAFVGGRYGNLSVLINEGNLTFTVASNEPWDATARTGNPLFEIRYSMDRFSAPHLADMDGDGDLDILIGDDHKYGGLGDPILYMENVDGKFTFERRDGLNTAPFAGVDVGNDAAPVFTDLDGDGDLDAVIGSKYNFGTYMPDIFVYLNEEGDFVHQPDHSLIEATNESFGIRPAFVDIDGDTDPDLFYGSGSEILFARNDNGVFTAEASPISYALTSSFSGENLSIAFMDFDKDGDQDAFVASNGYGGRKVVYLKNTNGTFAVAPAPSPFDELFDSVIKLNGVDFDNDGDMDIVIAETVYTSYPYYSQNTVFRFFENTGDQSFTELEDSPMNDIEETESTIAFADLDGDGDLDGFQGLGGSSTYYSGTIRYMENVNPPPVMGFSSESPTETTGNTAVVIDPSLSISDADNDLMSGATVAILDFRQGSEVLTFTAQAGITGSFNAQTGILTLSGSATRAIYTTLLRSVRYQYTGSRPSEDGRKPSRQARTKDITLNRIIRFSPLDSDFTLPDPTSGEKQVSILFPDNNQPPTITTEFLATNIGGAVAINLTSLVSDPDDNLDISLIEIGVNNNGRTTRANAPATFDQATQSISIDYSGSSFAGQDELLVRVFDTDGLSAEAIFVISVDDEIQVFNGISANGDDKNPILRLQNIEILAPENKVSIYNRWGSLVFDIRDYNNDTRKFDGRNNEGNELPSGTYFYKIEFSSNRRTQTGYLTIKR